MTSSYVEITLWGELLPLEKGQVVAFDPTHAALRALSKCHTVQHVYSEVAANFFETFSSTRPPTWCFNPMHLMVIEIAIIKCCCLVQHEGLFIGLCYQQPDQQPAPTQPVPTQPADFYLVINCDVNCLSCTKLAIDCVECTTTQKPSGYNCVTVWCMPFNNVNPLNLAQLVIILNYIVDEATQYNFQAENMTVRIRQ